MMIKIKPPTHRVDAGGVVIASSDCWDKDRIQRELEALEALALAELQDKAAETFTQANSKATEAEIEEIREACKLSDDEREAAHARHPVMRYRAGKTRFQPDCADTDHEGKPCTVRDYLTGEPTEFSVRRLPFSEVHRVDEIKNYADRLTAWMRRCLRAVRSPGGLQWEAKPGEEAPEDVLQAIHEGGGSLLWIELGGACAAYNRPLGEDEGKR